MLYTCSLKNYRPNEYKTMLISKDLKLNKVTNLEKLVPTDSINNEWKNNIGKISEIENTKRYIKKYYNEVLSDLDPENIYRDAYSNILLCDDIGTNPNLRHIIAAWLEIMLEIEIPDIKFNEKNIETLERPTYIKDLLEREMKSNTNMRGFTSLMALRLYEEGNKLDKKAEILEKKGKDSNWIRQQASYLRSEANYVEAKSITRKRA